MVAAGDHNKRWNPDHATHSSSTHVRLPLFQSGKKWATVELRFKSGGTSNWLTALWEHPLFRLIAAVAVLGFGLYIVYMRRTLRHLDPSAVIPSRVQNALDVMEAAGLGGRVPAVPVARGDLKRRDLEGNAASNRDGAGRSALLRGQRVARSRRLGKAQGRDRDLRRRDGAGGEDRPARGGQRRAREISRRDPPARHDEKETFPWGQLDLHQPSPVRLTSAIASTLPELSGAGISTTRSSTSSYSSRRARHMVA